MSAATLQSKKARVPKARPKVLVVEADWFLLTIKQDPNVAFWNARDTAQQLPLPESLEIVWLSKYVLDESRARILKEVRARGLEVWNCSVVELQRRLVPFWKYDWNRVFHKAEAISDAGESAIGYVMPKLSPMQQRAKLERLQSLKEAGYRNLVKTGQISPEGKRGRKRRESQVELSHVAEVVDLGEWKAHQEETELATEPKPGKTPEQELAERLLEDMGPVHSFVQNVMADLKLMTAGSTEISKEEFALLRRWVNKMKKIMPDFH